MLTNKHALSIKHFCLFIILPIILVRFISLGLYPLFDTTEARYGEIARIMFETGNWVTPQFDYNIPFWGKPPLHTWVSALSFSLFGINEFAARLPHFLTGLLCLISVHHFVKIHFLSNTAYKTSLILATTLGFLVATAMVMTDSLLLLAITLAMISFYHCYYKKSYFAGMLFFVALVIGMLAKGPVSIVLIGIPLVLWSLHTKQFWSAIKCLPWISGLILFITFTTPWYLLAEQSTPGFLKYFIWGEHVQRFLVSGWQGDLYGSAHQEAKGTIWLFWLAVAFPWSFIAIWLAFKHLKASIANKQSIEQDKMNRNTRLYFVYWLLAPMLLFTLAGNILPAYVLPSLPALAIVVAKSKISTRVLLRAALISASLFIAMIVYVTGGYSSKVSHKDVLSNLAQYQRSQPIFYWKKRPFSAQFYSQGSAQKVSNIPELIKVDALNPRYLLIVNMKDIPLISMHLNSRCTNFDKRKGFYLYQCGK